MTDDNIIYPGNWDALKDERGWEKWRDGMIEAGTPAKIADKVIQEMKDLEKVPTPLDLPDRLTDDERAAIRKQFDRYMTFSTLEWALRHYRELYNLGAL